MKMKKKTCLENSVILISAEQMSFWGGIYRVKIKLIETYPIDEDHLISTNNVLINKLLDHFH